MVETKTLWPTQSNYLQKIISMTLSLYLVIQQGPILPQEHGVGHQVLRYVLLNFYFVLHYLFQGTTEGLAMIESIMEHIAYTLNLDPLEVRINNIDKVKQEKLSEFINQMRKWASIDERKLEIAEYNKVSDYFPCRS